jgi:hypothetical protein
MYIYDEMFYCRIKNNFDLDSASKNMGTRDVPSNIMVTEARS